MRLSTPHTSPRPHIPAAPPPPLPLLQLFLKMDADCSGEVDASEFANLRDFEAGETEGQLAFIYDYLDTAFGNSDGVLSMSEWTVGMKDACAHLADADFEAEMAKLSTLLTNNQRNLWRSIFCRSHANTFVTAARAAGATHALFIQHANCHEAEGDDAATRSLGSALGLEMGDASALRESDGAIRLTNRGSAQCMVARDEWFGRLPVRPVVLCSPAKRTIETAMHMSGLAAAPPLVEIESMHPVGVHQTCEEIFVQKGRAGPLRAFLDVEGGETAFSSYAESVCEELAAKFREQGGGRRGGDTCALAPVAPATPVAPVASPCRRPAWSVLPCVHIAPSPSTPAKAAHAVYLYPPLPLTILPPPSSHPTALPCGTGTCPCLGIPCLCMPPRTLWRVRREWASTPSTRCSMSHWVRRRVSSSHYMAPVRRPFTSRGRCSEHRSASSGASAQWQLSWHSTPRRSRGTPTLHGFSEYGTIAALATRARVCVLCALCALP